MRILRAGIGHSVGQKYRHWDILRQLQPPLGLSHEDWWIGTKLARSSIYQTLPLLDKNGRQLSIAAVPEMWRMLREVDRDASGSIKGADQVTSADTRDTYLMKSLMEEAITSSQLEGAATTREAAKEMIQTGRPPADRSEQMIYNNYQAMLKLRELKETPLTPEVVFGLQRILTENTLDDPGAAGRFRLDHENIVVADRLDGKTLHAPPPASELPERLARLCVFANDLNSDPFIHPVARAILLHFQLAYDHPFVDGNGRTARALFYWSMANQGFWLCEYVSISRILKAAPGKYTRSFLYVETDEADVTYFVLNQLQVILRAIAELHDYLARKAAQLRDAEQLLRSSLRLRTEFNGRQLSLVDHAMRNPGFVYTIDSHSRLHNVSFETARQDLLHLAAKQLVEQRKKGRRFIFISPNDLRQRLDEKAQAKKSTPTLAETPSGDPLSLDSST